MVSTQDNIAKKVRVHTNIIENVIANWLVDDGTTLNKPSPTPSNHIAHHIDSMESQHENKKEKSKIYMPHKQKQQKKFN